MFILHVLVYLVIGVIAIYGSAAIHLVQAESKGYKAVDFWSEYSGALADMPVLDGSLVLGLILWPVRLAQFIMSFPDLYDMYELREEESQ